MKTIRPKDAIKHFRGSSRGLTQALLGQRKKEREKKKRRAPPFSSKKTMRALEKKTPVNLMGRTRHGYTVHYWLGKDII